MHSIECEFLNHYIANRENLLTEMVAAGVADRNTAKKLIIKVLYGGTVDGGINVPWWRDMCTEFKSIACQIATHSDHEKTLEIKKNDTKGTQNLHPRTMSTVLSNKENKCLEALYEYLKKRRCVPDGRAALIFDGMMVPDTPSIRARVTGGTFLKDASTHIFKETEYKIELIVKDFDEPFKLPDNYADTTDDIIVLDGKRDKVAADEFVKRYGNRLITCGKRVFWEDGKEIFTDDIVMVKKGVVEVVQSMPIYMSCKDSLIPYSENIKHAEDCAKSILNNKSLERPGFVNNLFECSINYLAFENGVYSFETAELLPYPVPDVFFMHKINRPFPVNVDPMVIQEVRRWSIPSSLDMP